MKRVSGLKISGVTIGVLALGALVGVYWIKTVAERKRGELDRELKATIVDFRARPGARTVFAGTPQPGNAWDDYDAALAEYQQISVRVMIRRDILDPRREDKPDGAHAQLPKFVSPIARLRRGARRAESKKDYAWELGNAMPTPSFTLCNDLSSFALLEARTLSKDGKIGEAVEEILDVMQFGRDFANDGPFLSYIVGMGISTMALGEAKELVESGKLDPASSEALERGLRAMSTELPSFEDSSIRETIFFGTRLVTESEQNFASTLYYLTAIEQLRSWTQRLAAASRVSWAEAVKVDAEVQVEVGKSWNSVAKIAAPSYTKTGGKAARLWLARTNILLAAVHRLRTGEMLEVDDPFASGKLKSSTKEGSIKVWSVGVNGVDDGGVGDWGRSDALDLLLEVPRK